MKKTASRHCVGGATFEALPVPSDHAIERAKERLGWSESALRRMIPRIMERGLWQDQTRGELRLYLDARSDGYANGSVCVVFAEHLFVLQGGTLVTVLRLPKELRHAAATKAKA